MITQTVDKPQRQIRSRPSKTPMILEECAICLDPMKKSHKTHTTECNHKFHIRCFEKVQSNNCPCCRAPVSLTMKHEIVIAKACLDTELELLKHRKIQEATWKAEYLEEIKDLERNNEFQKTYFIIFDEDMKHFVQFQRDRVAAVQAEIRNPQTFQGLSKSHEVEKRKFLRKELHEEKKYLKKREIYAKNQIRDYLKTIQQSNQRLLKEKGEFRRWCEDSNRYIRAQKGIVNEKRAALKSLMDKKRKPKNDKTPEETVQSQVVIVIDD